MGVANVIRGNLYVAARPPWRVLCFPWSILPLDDKRDKKITMKIKLLIAAPIITAIILSGVSLAYATSGACSDHGGVYCAAGASVDGYAVCSDTTVSSVPYSEMTECQGVVTCTQDQMNSLEQKYNALDDVNQIAALNSQITQIQDDKTTQEAGINTAGVVQNIVLKEMYSIEAAAQGKINNLKNQIYILQTDLFVKQGEISSACAADAYQIQDQQIANQATQERQQFAQTVCSGMNGQLDASGKCNCASGYDYDPSSKRCITVDQSCQSQYGLNVYGANGSCLCNSGYEWNQSGTACVLTSSPSTVIEPAASAVSNQTAASFRINSNLSAGARGPDVMTLQKFLESKGLLTLPAGTTEGYFGSLTKQALISFQLSAGLPAMGYCGQMTRQAISIQ